MSPWPLKVVSHLSRIFWIPSGSVGWCPNPLLLLLLRWSRKIPESQWNGSVCREWYRNLGYCCSVCVEGIFWFCGQTTDAMVGGWPVSGSGISGWPSFFLCNLFAAARECNKRHAVIFNISFASDSSAVIKRNVCFCYICCWCHVPCIRKLGLLLFVVAFLAIAIVEQGNNSPPFKCHSRTLSLSFADSICVALFGSISGLNGWTREGVDTFNFTF